MLRERDEMCSCRYDAIPYKIDPVFEKGENKLWVAVQFPEDREKVGFGVSVCSH